MNLSYRHIVSILHELLFHDASLSSSRLITFPTSISFIHIFLGSPLLLLLPSPHVNTISFSGPFALITCSGIIIFCFVSLCNNDKPPLIATISCSLASFVLLSVNATLSILLQIHILQASIFFSIVFVFVHVSQPYRTPGKTIAFIILISVSLLAFLFFHISHTSSLHCHSAKHHSILYLLFASTFAFYHGST